MTERSGIVVRGFALFALLLMTFCFTSSADAADHHHHASHQQAAHENHDRGTAYQDHQPQTPVFCAMRMDQCEGHCEKYRLVVDGTPFAFPNAFEFRSRTTRRLCPASFFAWASPACWSAWYRPFPSEGVLACARDVKAHLPPVTV